MLSFKVVFANGEGPLSYNVSGNGVEGQPPVWLWKGRLGPKEFKYLPSWSTFKYGAAKGGLALAANTLYKGMRIPGWISDELR